MSALHDEVSGSVGASLLPIGELVEQLNSGLASVQRSGIPRGPRRGVSDSAGKGRKARPSLM